MSEQTVARRYAHALYEEAESRDCLDAVDDDVEWLRQSLDETPAFGRLVDSPVIPQDKKKAVLQALLDERVEALMLQFLHLLVEKERETMLPRIVRAYQDLRDEQRGIVEVQARVAQPLDEADRDKLVDTLEAMAGQTVRLQIERDPELIGGLVIRIGDQVYDGSVRQKLDNLRERWEHPAVATNGTA